MSIPRHKLAIACMVWNDKNQILLVKNHTRGWEFPGGYVDQGESLKTAAVREVKEESGIDIQLTGFYGIDQNVADSTCIVIFEGKAIGGKLTHSDENQEAGFFSIAKAYKMIKLAAFKDRIKRCLNQKEHPFLNEI